MEGNVRTWFTPKQKAELWERWRSGQCVADIARALERRNKSGVYRVLALNGGIVPAPLNVVCFGTITLWHFDAAEWAPSTASFADKPSRPEIRHMSAIVESGQTIAMQRLSATCQ